MADTPLPEFTLKSFRSADGAELSYRQLGSGPGIVLLHGGMQSGHNLLGLGAGLQHRFTVYIPDRRGRGLSGPFGEPYSIATEVDDLRRLLSLTGASNLFGLSVGGLIALAGALELPKIARLAVYEPPVRVPDLVAPTGWIARYERERAAGHLAAAMVSVFRGTGDPDWMNRLPRFLSVSMYAAALALRPDLGVNGGPPLRTLIPLVHYDIELIVEMAGSFESFRRLQTPTLLLAGTRSLPYLAAAPQALARIMPNARRVTIEGAGHNTADSTENPQLVASELIRFFE